MAEYVASRVTLTVNKKSGYVGDEFIFSGKIEPAMMWGYIIYVNGSSKGWYVSNPDGTFKFKLKFDRAGTYTVYVDVPRMVMG